MLQRHPTKLLTCEDIIEIISNDQSMMDILGTVRPLDLPDWWICAGFVRSKVWDVLHGFSERTPLGDVDVIYFDNQNVDESTEKVIEAALSGKRPNVPWSVKNQARMHVLSGNDPYESAIDGISKFPETATAIGVRLEHDGTLTLAAPWGVEDLLNLIVRPTPLYDARNAPKHKIYTDRVKRKRWGETWPDLKITFVDKQINIL